jgi:uncharacterized protein
VDSELTTELLVGLAITVGVVGIVVPILPGALLVWAAILVWAVLTQTTSGWVVLALATAAIVAAQVVKYLVPHRRLRNAGVPRSSIVAGGVLGVIGFFVIPVVGLVIGFVAGIYAAEHQRLRGRGEARQATKAAMRAVGLAILIELTGALAAAGAWLTAVVLT